MSWLGIARQWAAQRQSAHRREENVHGWWRSLDAAWLLIATSGLAVLLGAGALLGWLHVVHGVFDGPVVQPAPDHRILTNVRSAPSPFADAAVVAGDNALFAVRKDGTVHRRDLSTRVWSEEQFDPGRLFTSPVAILQPGCGAAVPPPACAGSGDLYAVTEAGGVAVRRDGRWRMLAGDNSFAGADGQPVAQSAIRSMAPAMQGRFLVFGTDSQGIGVFDAEQRRWIEVPAGVQQRIFGETGPAFAGVVRLTADSRGRVWVGTGRGVGVLSGFGRRLEGTRVDGLSGETLDMLPEPDGGMLVLGIERCPDPAGPAGGACTALRRVDGRGAAAETVAGETERNDFSETDIHHVAAIGKRIRAFGAKGVYDYVEESRRWELVCRGEVTAIWQAASGGPVVYAQVQDAGGRGPRCHTGDEKAPGAVVTIVQPENDAQESWKIPDERIEHIALGGDGQPWLLARPGSNKVYALRPEGPKEIADASQVPGSSPAALDRMTAAVEVDGKILFVGPGGAVLHDPVARTYRFIDRNRRPEDLVAPGVRLYASGSVVWIVSRDSWISAVIVRGGGAAGLDRVQRQEAGPAGTRVTSAQPTAQGLLVTVSTGGVYLADVTSRNTILMTPALGPPPARRIGPLVDAQAGPAGVIVADQGGLFRYDAGRRGWSGPSGGLPQGEPVAGFAQADSGVFVLGTRGSVVRENGGGRLFGDGAPFPFGRNELTDAWFADQRLYLAAAGRVAIYDVERRWHVDQWDLPAGALKIAGIVNRQPVVWDRQGAWLGRDRLMAGDGARVLSASVSGSEIITLQQDDQGLFLAAFDGRSADPRCLFRETESAQGTMLDARPVSLPPNNGSGGTAVLGPDRLRIYAPSQRRWVTVEGVVSSPTARLAHLDSHLAIQDRGNDRSRLTLVPLSGHGALQLPDSCARQRASVAPPAAIVTVEAPQIAVDEDGRRAALLEQSGQVGQWTASRPRFTTVLPAAGAAPQTRDLKRVVQQGRLLHFAAPDGVWTYDLDARAWTQRRLTAAARTDDPLRPKSLSLAPAGNELALSIRDDRNRDFGAVIDADAGPEDGGIDQIREIGPGPPVKAPFDPARLVDAAERDPYHWLFLSSGQLAIFDAGAATWKWTSAPGIGTPGSALMQFGGPGGVVAVAEGGDPGRPDRLVFPPLDLAGTGDADPAAAVAGTSAVPAVDHAFLPGRGERYAVAMSGDASGPRIVRVPGTNEVLSCPIAPSGEVGPCETVLPPPLKLDAASVSGAWSFGGVTLVATSGNWRRRPQWRLIDRLRRAELPKPGLPDFDPGQMTLHVAGDQLWLRDRGGRVRALNRDGEVKTIASGPSQLREIGGAVWIVTGATAQRAAPDGTIEEPADILRRAGRPDVTPKAFLPAGDGRIHVLTTAGEAFAIDRDGQVLQSTVLRLAEGVDPDKIRSAAFPSLGAAGRAWVQQGDALVLVERSRCPVPGSRAPRPCVTKVESRPLPPALASGEILRDVDGGRFVFESAAYTFDGRAAAWRRTGAAPGVGANLPAAPDVKDEIAAAAGDGGRLDAAVMEQAGPDVIVSRPTLPASPPLRFRGAMTAERLPALGDSRGRPRWLRFDRATRQFQVRSAQQSPIAVAAADLFPGGVFAPTLEGRSVITGRQEFVHANESGLWRFPVEHDWVENGPAWTRIRLATPVTAARGRFYFRSGWITVDGAGGQPDEAEHVVSNDGLIIRENIRGESIAATLDVAGRPANALAPAGFQHDQRQAIAFDQNGVVIATPAGIVGARDFHALALPPDWTSAGDAALFNADGLLYAKAGRRFFKAGGNGWSEVAADPRLQPQRPLARETGRDWVRSGDAVAARGDDWRTRFGTGWRFTADQLEGVAHTAGGGIVAISREGIVEAPDLDGLAAAGPPRRKPAGAVGALERLFREPGNPVTGFVSPDGSGKDRLSLLLNERSAWAPPQGDPLNGRVAVRSPLLSITFRNSQAAVEAVAERPLGGGPATVAVDWRRDEHFPFDQATAIAAQGATLYVGTEAGLLAVSAASTASPPRLIDTGKGDGSPARVDRIGRPAAAPSRLVVRSGAACLDIAEGGLLRCTDPQALDERSLGATGYWKWTAKTAPEMVYLDPSGRAVGRPVTNLADGFPHDRPVAAVDCPAGGRISLWDDGLALETPPGSWALDGRNVISDLRSFFPGPRAGRAPSSGEKGGTPAAGAAAPAALHCQPVPLRLPDGATVAAGVRALAPSGGIAIRDGANWRMEPPAIAAAVLERWRGAIPYDHARLRLVDLAVLAGQSEPKGLELQYFTRAQQWRPLKTGGGRYLVDERQRIVQAGATPYVLTPEGLVKLERSGGFRLNPDAVDIIAVPCGVDRIETADGLGLALPAEADAPTLVRCRDGAVLQGRLGGENDDDVFTQRRPSDPFAGRLLAATGDAVTWRIVDRTVGQPGRLDASWRGEPLRLSGGRFALDAWRSLAHVGVSGFIEFASAQGWIRSPRGRLSLKEAQRPAVQAAISQDVRALATDRDADQKEVLCLVDGAGQTVVQRFSRPPGGGAEVFERQEMRDCGRFEGGEGAYGPWTYRAGIREPSALAMRGQDHAGAPLNRLLSNGRFSDLTATGAPLSFAAGNGRSGEATDGALTLIPTAAGVTRIAAAGGELPVRTYGAPAIALLVTAAGDLEVLTPAGFEGPGGLRQTCPVERKLAGLGDIGFGALGVAGDGLLELSGRRGDERVFYSLSCSAAETAVLPWWMAVPVSGRRRVTANRLPWDRIWLHWSGGDLTAGASRPSPDLQLRRNLQPPLRFLNAGDHAYALLRDDVLEIDIDPLVSALNGAR